MSDDEDEKEEDYGKEEHEKEAIAEEIFQDGEGEEGGDGADGHLAAADDEEDEEEDESGMCGRGPPGIYRGEGTSSGGK